ncbi:hypothetical protein J6590_094808 [Homalodisca vitripennis]|nr:hypothetical protein J6590_076175 [Homalodisca vitripennis]KAG8319303.1 hypothetical protein J6590_094808 [Homalodisca vitripennis]
MNNVNRQDHVPTHEIASPSTENTLQLAPETQQISATELNGERCKNLDVAATHPPATGDCGLATAGSGNRDGFSIHHRNIRSVKHEDSELCLSWARAPDTIYLTEHWLGDG